MLYLDSLENQNRDTAKTGQQYVISRDKVSGMPNIVELAPSKELLQQWESQSVSWEEFQQRFKDEMRAEYRKNDKSRLKGLAKYSLENDVTLYSPEPPSEQTYRAILGEIVNGIWQREGRTERVVELAQAPADELVQEPADDPRLTAAHRRQMEGFAAECEFFTPIHKNSKRRSCHLCEHLDQQVFLCPKIEKVVIVYEWAD